jgi:hypothetical protein
MHRDPKLMKLNFGSIGLIGWGMSSWEVALKNCWPVGSVQVKRLIDLITSKRSSGNVIAIKLRIDWGHLRTFNEFWAEFDRFKGQGRLINL